MHGEPVADAQMVRRGGRGAMSEVIYGYAPEVVETIRESAPPAVRRLLDHGVVMIETPAERGFEAWLIEKWRRDIGSEAFRETAEYEYLRAQWEREG